MDISKLPNAPMSVGRVSHTVIPRSDAESGKQPGILDSAFQRNDSMRDTPLWSAKLGDLRMFNPIKERHQHMSALLLLLYSF